MLQTALAFCTLGISEPLKLRKGDVIKLKALHCFTTRSPYNNWRLLLNTQQPWRLMLPCISVSDRPFTLILMLNWYIRAKWKLPTPPCLQGNGLENERLHAIILLENQYRICGSVKSGFNDVRRFLRGGEECLMQSGTGEMMVWDMCSQWTML